MFNNRLFVVLYVIACLGTTASSRTAVAQTAESSHYAGKNINMILGYPPGGANDVFGRLVTRHFGRFIPGSPRLVLQHMPGAGSATAANYVFNVAPRDGSVLALLVPTLPLEERMGASQVKFKSKEFTWIGRLTPAPNVTFIGHTSNVKTYADALKFESALGATGRSASNAIYPFITNNLLGTKFKIVMGYQGSAAAMLAMERGEVEGHSPTLDTLMTLHPDWVTESKVNIVLQYLDKRHRDLPNVPTAVEFAKTDEERQIMRFAVSPGDIGKYILSTPALAPDVTALLRDSFLKLIVDSQFQADATQQRVALDPLNGVQLEKIVYSVIDAPDDIVSKLKAAYPN